MPRAVAFTEPQLREAISASHSLAEAIRLIGLRPSGGNHVTVRRYAERWNISIEHLRVGGAYPRGGRKPTPLEEILVRGSTYHRAELKRRLYKTGLKTPICELCGQSEEWRGARMALILDHVNGDATDNRLVNLRIVCPNCNATLETHCGRGLSSRRAERPPLDVLLTLVAAEGYEAVGRHFGVSGNAVRKWLRRYGVTPPPGTGRASHPPPVPPPALSDAEALRALGLLAGGASVYSVVKITGVSKSTITDLKRGRTYRHLARPAELRDAA